MKSIINKSFFLLVALVMLSCSQKSEIETESLHKQLLISEQRNADEVHEMLKLIYWHEENASQESIDVANEVRKILNLKNSLGVKASNEKFTILLPNKSVQIYFDSLTHYLLKVDSNSYVETIQRAHEQLSALDHKNLDGQYHQLLLLSELEGKLFAIYSDSIGVGATYDIFYPCVAFRKKVLFANQKNQIAITPVAKVIDHQFRLTYSNSMLHKEGSEIPIPHSFQQLGNAAIIEFSISEPGNYEYTVGVNKSPETQRVHYVTEKFELVEENNVD